MCPVCMETNSTNRDWETRESSVLIEWAASDPCSGGALDWMAVRVEIGRRHTLIGSPYYCRSRPDLLICLLTTVRNMSQLQEHSQPLAATDIKRCFLQFLTVVGLHLSTVG